MSMKGYKKVVLSPYNGMSYLPRVSGRSKMLPAVDDVCLLIFMFLLDSLLETKGNFF